MGECTRGDLSSTSGDLTEMLDGGARRTSGARNATSLSRTCPPESKTTFPSSPRGAHGPLPRGLRLRRRPTGGAAATPPPPRRNLRGPGAACFLFVGRGDMAAVPAAAGSGVGRGRRAAATVAAWGGWGGRPRPGNILLQLRQGQLTGRGLVRAVQVRSRPGGAGRGGPGGSWRGGRARGLSRPPLYGPDPSWLAAGPPCGLSRRCQLRRGSGQRQARGSGLGAEQGWAASGIDGVYES